MNNSNFLENLVEAIKTSKEYVYKVENVCKVCKHRIHVYRWMKAKDDNIDFIKKEIERAYEPAFTNAFLPNKHCARRVKVSDLKVDKDLFIRSGPSEDAIQRYMEQSCKEKAIKVQTKTLIVVDGWHRLEAPNAWV